MSAKAKDDVKKLFNKHSGHDKKLGKKEFKGVLQKVGQPMSNEQVTALFGKVDTNNDGNVDLNELLAYLFEDDVPVRKQGVYHRQGMWDHHFRDD